MLQVLIDWKDISVFSGNKYRKTSALQHGQPGATLKVILKILHSIDLHRLFNEMKQNL